MSVILNDMELPKDCMKCPLDNFLICKVSHGLCTSDYRPSHCPLKSIEGLIEKIKEKCKYNNKDKLSDYSIDLDELINTIEEYCEVKEYQEAKAMVNKALENCFYEETNENTDYIRKKDILDKLLYMGYLDEQKSEIEETINRMPSVKPVTQWHKIEDGLPKENGDYLVTYGKNTYMAHYSKNIGWVNEYGVPYKKNAKYIVAWMPLPEWEE